MTTSEPNELPQAQHDAHVQLYYHDLQTRCSKLRELADHHAHEAGTYAWRMTEAQQARDQALRQAVEQKERAEAAEKALQVLHEAALPFHQAFEFSKVLHIRETIPRCRPFLIRTGFCRPKI